MELLNKYLKKLNPPLGSQESDSISQEFSIDISSSDLMVKGFDWNTWSRENEIEIVFAKHDKFEKNDLEFCLRYLTKIIREDRFVDNYLSSEISNGNVYALIKRLLTLLNQKSTGFSFIERSKEKILFEEFKKNLVEKHSQEQRIANYIKSKGFRFSIKKFTADIGEYYSILGLLNTGDFKNVLQEEKSNSSFDALGILNSNSGLKKRFQKSNLRIEVKTRRDQEGVKYLGGINPAKFDLLCVADLFENYLPRALYLVDNNDITKNNWLDQKRSRLIFRNEMKFDQIDSFENTF